MRSLVQSGGDAFRLSPLVKLPGWPKEHSISMIVVPAARDSEYLMYDGQCGGWLGSVIEDTSRNFKSRSRALCGRNARRYHNGNGLSFRSAAGPPFLTDDPEPVDLKHWEVYVFGQGDRTADADAVLGRQSSLTMASPPTHSFMWLLRLPAFLRQGTDGPPATAILKLA